MKAMRPGLPDPLIGLLGARWDMGAPAVGAAWLGEAVAFGLRDGTIAIVRAAWEGAASLRPREGGGVELVPATEAAPPAMRLGVHAGACLAIVADGEGGALSGGVDGRLARVGADGTSATLASFPGARIQHVAAAGGAAACAAGARVHRFGADAAVLELPHPVLGLAFNPAGDTLAIAQPDGVMLWAGDAALVLAAPGGTLAWSPDGRELVSGCHGWRLPDGGPFELAGARSVSFSGSGGWLAAGGARRVACWRLDDPPRHSECGPGGMAIVSQVACHPVRPLIAAGYENGTVLLCQPDSSDILFARGAGDGAVTTLAWSADGGTLALATADGEIGIIAFPTALFRTTAELETAP